MCARVGCWVLSRMIDRSIRAPDAKQSHSSFDSHNKQAGRHMEPPPLLQLKATATAAADTTTLVSSKAWKVKLQQRGLYTGGKVRMRPLSMSAHSLLIKKGSCGVFKTINPRSRRL